jgi:hypothetical protein
LCAHNLIEKLIVMSKFFGSDSEEATPVPIPNTEVKVFSADGTAWATKWESRTLPKIFINPESFMAPGFLRYDAVWTL